MSYIPKENDKFYHIIMNGPAMVVCGGRFSYKAYWDKARVKDGNIFETREEAQEMLDKVLKLLKERV